MPTHPVFTSNCRSSRVSGACDQSCRASHMRGCLSESSDSKCPLQTPQGTSVVSGGDIGSRGNRGGKKRVELHPTIKISRDQAMCHPYSSTCPLIKHPLISLSILSPRVLTSAGGQPASGHGAN